MKIEKIKENEVEEITTCYLEGILMPNGEFCCNGRSFWVQKEDKLYKVVCDE